jgi:hypothetical protein
MPQPIFKKLGVYIMAPEPISTAYFINPSLQSLCQYMYPHIVARQQLGKNITATTNTLNNRRIVGSIIFFAVCVVSKESRRECLPRISCYNRRLAMYNFTVFDLPQFQISLLLVAGGVNKDRMD